MPHKIKVEAKEVSLAIEKGLKELGLRRDQVEVKVLENPRKGFLGIGARPAVVELRQKRWVSGNLDAQIYMDVPKKKRSSGGRSSRSGGRNGSRSNRKQEEGVHEIKRGGRRAYSSRRRGTEEKAPRLNEKQLLPSLEIQNAVIPDYLQAPLQQAQDFLSNVLSHMGVTPENLHAWWDEKQHRILLTFDCDHPAIVIGKEGKTLEALQYLATLSLSRHFDKPISVIADTQNYWRKMEDKINSDLEYGINQIKNGYSVYRFRPMSAQLRRYIHRAAENNEFVITVSEGEDQWRKVTLRPRPADQPVQKAPVEEVSAELPQTEPVQEETACPTEQTCNCAENDKQTGCACSEIYQTTTETTEVVVEVAVEQNSAEQAVVTEPAAQEQAVPAAQAEETAAPAAATTETPVTEPVADAAQSGQAAQPAGSEEQK